MKIEKVVVSVGHTVNVENYESIKFEQQITGVVEEGEDVAEVRESLTSLVAESNIHLLRSALIELEERRNSQEREGLRLKRGVEQSMRNYCDAVLAAKNTGNGTAPPEPPIVEGSLQAAGDEVMF